MKCPHCGSTNLPVRTAQGVKVAECCGQQFDPKTGKNLNTGTGLMGAVKAGAVKPGAPVPPAKSAPNKSNIARP